MLRATQLNLLFTTAIASPLIRPLKPPNIHACKTSRSSPILLFQHVRAGPCVYNVAHIRSYAVPVQLKGKVYFSPTRLASSLCTGGVGSGRAEQGTANADIAGGHIIVESNFKVGVSLYMYEGLWDSQLSCTLP